LSEPGSGAHLYFPESKLLDRGGQLVLRGEKAFVTSGGHADSYVVSTALAGGGNSPGEFSLVVVPGEAEGADWGEPWRGLGMRGNSSRSVEFRDVELPKENLLGSHGDEIWYVFNVVAPSFISAISGTYLGIATAALEEAREHLAGRSYEFGKRAPGETGTVQRDLGDLWRRVESTRRLVYHAAETADAGSEESTRALFAAKADVARMATRAVNDAMTLVGGRGYGENSTLGRLLRDARAADVMAPTTQMLETWIGRDLLDLPILTE
jgi:alkylation response protein AidB-like acyl-CoA dehydrogenase